MDDALAGPGGGGRAAGRFRGPARDADGRPTGYATWSRGGAWTAYGGPAPVEVDEFVAADPGAARNLLAFFGSLDLCREVVLRNRPVLDPLRRHFADIRRMRMVDRVDKLWARVLDVPRVVRACMGRLDRPVTIAVHDPGKTTDGCYTLAPDGDRVRCEPTGHRPDLTIDVADLTACLLGAVSAAELAGAGRLAGDRDALSAVARALAAQVPPHCSTGF